MPTLCNDSTAFSFTLRLEADRTVLNLIDGVRVFTLRFDSSQSNRHAISFEPCDNFRTNGFDRSYELSFGVGLVSESIVALGNQRRMTGQLSQPEEEDENLSVVLENGSSFEELVEGRLGLRFDEIV